MVDPDGSELGDWKVSVYGPSPARVFSEARYRGTTPAALAQEAYDAARAAAGQQSGPGWLVVVIAVKHPKGLLRRPVLHPPGARGQLHPAGDDPTYRAMVADSLSLAFLVLLESLSPE